MIKKTNPPAAGKAKDLAIIAVICEEKNFVEIVKAFEYADEKHKRYTLFKRVIHVNDIRGQRWDGYIKMWTPLDNREVDQVIMDLDTRGVKQLQIVRTKNGPLIGLPNKSEVIS